MRLVDKNAALHDTTEAKVFQLRWGGGEALPDRGESDQTESNEPKARQGKATMERDLTKTQQLACSQ